MVNHEKREGRRRRKNVDKNKTKIYNIFQKGTVIWKIPHSSPFYLFPWLLPDQRTSYGGLDFVSFIFKRETCHFFIKGYKNVSYDSLKSTFLMQLDVLSKILGIRI